MQTILTPYINFKNTTREAMQFYHGIFGGNLTMSTFAEGGMPHDQAQGDYIMHAQLDGDNGLTFMASDMPGNDEYKGPSGISISISGDNESQIRGYYEKLLVGGTIGMPLEKAPWGDMFGFLTDKYGVSWMFDISPASDVS